MSRHCPQCGHEGAPADLYCSRCGTVLLDRDASDETFVDPAASSGSMPVVGSGHLSGVASGDAVLVVRRGPSAGAQFVLTAGREVTAGRANDSDIFLDDVTVSRAHAVLEDVSGTWVIRDAGSLNGTYVNRLRVDRHTLAPGDEVQIGKYRFVFLLGEEPLA